jgi:hypothetical protein
VSLSAPIEIFHEAVGIILINCAVLRLIMKYLTAEEGEIPGRVEVCTRRNRSLLELPIRCSDRSGEDRTDLKMAAPTEDDPSSKDSHSGLEHAEALL